MGDTSGFFLFLFIVSFLQPEYLFVHAECNFLTSCNQTGPAIQYPFWQKEQEYDRCGNPGFELSCNNKNQTILKLSYSGDFLVKDIDYLEQRILINDPDSCLPKRMQNFTPTGFLQRGFYSRRYKFFNCSSNLTYNSINAMGRPVPLSCLSSRNYSVYAVPSFIADQGMPSSCVDINKNDSGSPEWSTSRYWSLMNSDGDLQLMWSDNRCWICETQGSSCLITDDNRVACLIPSEKSKHGGLSRGEMYGIILGVGVPALLLIVGLAGHICSKIKAYNHESRRLSAELSATITPQSVITITTGLDGEIIESYPKTVLGESRRLPNANDHGTCPICLSEYQPKDTLRTIPECNHYFHVDCIDEWLKRNGTCPLCRNSPETLFVTPCSSVSLPSTTTTTATSTSS